MEKTLISIWFSRLFVPGGQVPGATDTGDASEQEGEHARLSGDVYAEPGPASDELDQSLEKF